MKHLKYGGFLAITLVLSGCWKKKKATIPEGQESVGYVVHEQPGKIFDADEKGFVLRAEENPFAPSESVTLVEEPASVWSEEEARFETIYFDFNRDAIRPDQVQALKRVRNEISKALEANPDVVVVIEGHACNSAGSPTYNMGLSERRAMTVRDTFVAQGLPAERMTVVGRGSEMRKVSTGNREQQAPNRRVEFHLVTRKK